GLFEFVRCLKSYRRTPHESTTRAVALRRLGPRPALLAAGELLGVAHILLDLREVPDHPELGGIAVALGDRVGDAGVEEQRQRALHGFGVARRRHDLVAPQELRDHLLEVRIARRPGDRLVEDAVALDEGFRRPDVGPHHPDAAPELRHVVGGRAAGGERGGARLQRFAELQRIAQRGAADRELREGIARELLAVRGEEGTAVTAALDPHQAEQLEGPDRLTDRAAADAEALLEIAVGRQPVAGLELAAGDIEADLLDDVFEHPLWT